MACLVVLATVVLSLTGCRGRQYENRDIGFWPPGTVYLTNWKYMVELYVETSDPGSTYVLQDKTAWIRVSDTEGRRLLDDRLDIRRCQVIGTVTWTRFDELQVELSEDGVEYTGEDAQYNDPYSVALARSGPRHFMTLRYRYDPTSKVFVRVK